MGKEGPKIEKVEGNENSDLGYPRAETLDTQGLIREYVFFGSTDLDEITGKEHDFSKRMVSHNQLEELRRAFDVYYGSELALRLSPEQMEKISANVPFEQKFFNHVIMNIDTIDKGEETKIFTGPEYSDIYKSIEKDTRDYFQLGWDDPEIKKEDIFGFRKKIVEKYIELVGNKKPEMFKAYIQSKEKVQSNPGKGTVRVIEIMIEELKDAEEQ